MASGPEPLAHSSASADDAAQSSPIDIVRITLGVPEWSATEGWVDGGDLYYEAELFTVGISLDQLRAIADELGGDASEGTGCIVEMRTGRHDIGATGPEVASVLVLVAQTGASIALERAFERIVDKMRRVAKSSDDVLTEDVAIEKARLRIATRYDTESGRLQLVRTTDGPDAIEVELAEPGGLPRYVVEVSRSGHAWKITRQVQT